MLRKGNWIRDENTPLHRSYGVKKRVSVFTHINSGLAVVMAIAMIVTLAVMWIAGAIMLIILMGGIGTAIAIIATISFVYFKLCRKMRKRAKLMRRLKRRCRKLGYTVTRQRGFFKGLKLNKEGFDLTVDTGKKLWCVRFFTPPKYFCHLVILSKDEMQFRFNITQSYFKFILGLNEEKRVDFDYRFDDELPETHKNAERALLLNPVPHELFKKDEDGAVIPTGTGTHIHGYTVFTGTGFLQTLERESRE